MAIDREKEEKKERMEKNQQKKTPTHSMDIVVKLFRWAFNQQMDMNWNVNL